MHYLKLTDKRALTDWSEYKENLLKMTTIDESENEQERLVRITRLEADPEAWFMYYFPNYCYAEPADFHKRATRRIIKNDVWYEVRAWSRELAKSSRAMMEIMYLALIGKVKNVVLVSHSYDQAEKLLKPFKLNFELNRRIINDYGIQQKMGEWESGLFFTKIGCSFAAIGAGQSPRGFKNEEIRPDVLLIDDIDTDEETRNQKRIDNKFKWIEEALIFSMSVSKSKRILFLGNIIGKETCIVKASKKADYFEIINIRDKNGQSVWEKNTEEQIDWLLSKVSYAAGQKEFFNNPITEGSVFKDITWGKVPPLSSLKFAVAYGDPSPSNKENKSGSYKCVFLIGEENGIYYIYNGFLEHTGNAVFVRWYWDLQLYANQKTQIYNYIENNSLQDPFYEQVFIPLFEAEGNKNGLRLYATPDERKKPDKFTRIEGNLEPLNRLGKLVFNAAERNNPHMMRLEEQFKAVEPGLGAPADGPDAVEGGIWIIQNKLHQVKKEDFSMGPRGNSNSKNRY